MAEGRPPSLLPLSLKQLEVVCTAAAGHAPEAGPRPTPHARFTQRARRLLRTLHVRT